jgi:hypothetical protein
MTPETSALLQLLLPLLVYIVTIAVTYGVIQTKIKYIEAEIKKYSNLHDRLLLLEERERTKGKQDDKFESRLNDCEDDIQNLKRNCPYCRDSSRDN